MNKSSITTESAPSVLLDWLLAGDVAIQYQTWRDLLHTERPDLQARIATEGWGATLLAARQPQGHWGQGFYQPKWISSHYTLLDLCLLGLPRDHPAARDAVAHIAAHHKGPDGGINPGKTIMQSDICVNGMFLQYATWFGLDPEALISVVDFILTQRMPDGGFNCRLNRSGARHSSLHSTISLLEGIHAYRNHGYTHRLAELEEAERNGREFILLHRLFRSDRTGEIIKPAFLKLTFPGRWYYDILRALDYFQAAGIAYDPRMQDALDILEKKRNRNGSWNMQAAHAGKVHVVMEPAGKPSRWNTLRALRVRQAYPQSRIPDLRP